MRFQLITYNIHKGIGGVDRRYRPERIIETLQHYQPDFLLLQEVDEGVPRSRHHRQVDLLGDALELPHRAFQANVRLRTGTYGNAILSRFPLTDVEHIELTIPLKKRRRALAAHCRIHGHNGHSHTLVIVNCHRGRLRLHGAHASHTAVARRASDHLPLIAEFEMVCAGC